MAKIVEADHGQPGPVKQRTEGPAKVRLIQRRANCRGEHEAGFLPPAACPCPFLGLPLAMTVEGRDHDRGQGNRAAAVCGLGFGKRQLAIDALHLITYRKRAAFEVNVLPP